MVMAVGKADPPLEFESLDGRPCNLIVLLASPMDQTGPHIQALAKVSKLWQAESFRQAIVAAQTADEVYAAIANDQA